MLARDALRGSRTTSFEATRKIERVDTIEDQEAETWIEEVIRRRSMTEERETLTTLHLSVLKDWNELKTRVNINNNLFQFFRFFQCDVRRMSIYLSSENKYTGQYKKKDRRRNEWNEVTKCI